MRDWEAIGSLPEMVFIVFSGTGGVTRGLMYAKQVHYN